MLDGLDDIPWKDLTHAYGEASDVPEILREIAAGEDAVGPLFGNIWHQGTVYEATSRAVPFLIELLSVEGARRELCWLLSSIANGTSYIDVHRDMSHWRAMNPDVDEEERERLKELHDVKLARDAVLAGLPTYRKYLVGEHADERANFAALVARCGDIDSLGAQLLVEDFPDVRATIALEMIEVLGDREPPPVLLALRDSKLTEDRYCAGILDLALTEGEGKEGTLDLLMTFAKTDSLDTVDCVSEEQGALFYALRRTRGKPEPLYALVDRCLEAGGVLELEALTLIPQLVEERRDAVQLYGPLVERLGTESGERQRVALEGLALFGSTQPLPVGVVNALEEETPWTIGYGRALNLLCQHEHEAAKQALAEHLDQAIVDRHLPVGLVERLKHIGPWADGLFPKLLQLMNPEVTSDAPGNNAPIGVIRAAANYDEITDYLPLIASLHASYPHIVAIVLSEHAESLEPLASDLTTALDALHQHEQLGVRLNALRADWRKTSEDKVHACIAAIEAKPKYPGRVASAMELLGELGELAAPALPLLEPLLDSPDQWVACRSSVAYGRITGDAARIAPVFARLLKPVPVGLIVAREILRYPGEVMAPCKEQLKALVESPFIQMTWMQDKTACEADAIFVSACRAALEHIGGN